MRQSRLNDVWSEEDAIVELVFTYVCSNVRVLSSGSEVRSGKYSHVRWKNYGYSRFRETKPHDNPVAPVFKREISTWPTLWIVFFSLFSLNTFLYIFLYILSDRKARILLSSKSQWKKFFSRDYIISKWHDQAVRFSFSSPFHWTSNVGVRTTKVEEIRTFRRSILILQVRRNGAAERRKIAQRVERGGSNL